jgi:branched-chain amino acid transport system ATP-binding protein
MALLRIDNVSRSFYGFTAVDGVSFEVERGELVGLIGPNGSGKTTLFNCITGLLRPSGGSVHFDDRDVTGKSPDRIYHSGMARTFQLIQMFPEMTVVENMLTAAQERSGTMLSRLFRREDAVAARRADELIDYLGLTRVRDNHARDLSYGQQKLLDFGMALMPNPQLVLLDEPLAGVNPSMINQLVDRIRGLNDKGHTFVVIEHNMDVLMSLCRRVVVLSQGRKLTEGTPGEVSADPRVIDAYFGT